MYVEPPSHFSDLTLMLGVRTFWPEEISDSAVFRETGLSLSDSAFSISNVKSANSSSPVSSVPNTTYLYRDKSLPFDTVVVDEAHDANKETSNANKAMFLILNFIDMFSFSLPNPRHLPNLRDNDV